MDQTLQRKVARARSVVLKELRRVADRVDCDDKDRWTICVTVEGEQQYYVPRNDRLMEFANADLLWLQVDLVEWLDEGVDLAFDAVDVGCSTRGARARSTCTSDICLELGEQILHVEEALALKDGKRNQEKRILAGQIYDPDEVLQRVADLTEKLGTKTKAVNAAAKDDDMPSVRRIWGILKEAEATATL